MAEFLKMSSLKDSQISTLSTFVKEENYKAEMESIKKDFERLKKIQKAKNWKNRLTN